jgi:hypothetical protein
VILGVFDPRIIRSYKGPVKGTKDLNRTSSYDRDDEEISSSRYASDDRERC